MKYFRTVVTVMLLMTIDGSQAQIFDKINEAASQNEEKNTKNKTRNKAANRNADYKGMGFGKNRIDISKVPDNYEFTWKYALKVTTDKGKEVVMDYFLQPNSDYVGASTHQSGSDMFMVMDHKNKIMVTAFGNGTEKMAMASKMPDNEKSAVELDPKYTKFTYKALPNKVILGYNCKGVEASNASYIMTFYYTTDAKISFANVFKMQNAKSKAPDFFKDYFKPGEKPLMLQMETKDLKNGGALTVMECIALNKESRSFKKADYKFM